MNETFEGLKRCIDNGEYDDDIKNTFIKSLNKLRDEGVLTSKEVSYLILYLFKRLGANIDELPNF